MSKEQEKLREHKHSESNVIHGDAASVVIVGGSDMMVVEATGGVPQLDNDPSPVLDPENPIIQLLQLERDFYECFIIVGLTHLTIEGIDKIQSKITKKRIPLKVRLGTGIALSLSLLGLAETDLGGGRMGTPDWKDIPAGIVGTFAYPFVDYKLRKKFLSSPTENQHSETAQY